MEGRAQPDDFATSFEAAFARLQVVLEMACVQEGPWSGRAVGAIHAALELAAAEPQTANVLTNEALAEGVDGVQRYERLMTYVAGLLEGGRAESPHGDDLPPTTERTIAGGVATIIGDRVGRGSRRDLAGLAPEVVQFVLTPYLGTTEARRIATVTAADWPPGQPGR
jgi:hypothetical protein